MDNYRLDLVVATPYLYSTSNYTINGRILVLPIVGNGDSWANYSMYKQLPIKQCFSIAGPWPGTGLLATIIPGRERFWKLSF